MSGTPQTFRAYRIPLYDHMNITNSVFSILFESFQVTFLKVSYFFNTFSRDLERDFGIFIIIIIMQP